VEPIINTKIFFLIGDYVAVCRNRKEIQDDCGESMKQAENEQNTMI